MTDDVLIFTNGPIGHISLNRPKALNALTLEMCHAMSASLTAWAQDDDIKAVILDHNEGRGFCAGGDIAFLRDSALNDGGVSGRKFFHDEYQLNHQMFCFVQTHDF
jgi:enoyl-CoA hydratase